MQPEVNVTIPTADEVFIALCQLAAGHNREKALTMINHFLDDRTTAMSQAEILASEEQPPVSEEEEQ